MMPALALFAMDRLVHLSGVDIAIVVIYFALVLAIGFYLKRFAKTGEDFFHGRARNDRLGRRTRLRLRQSRLA